MDTSGGLVAYGATNSDAELKNLNYVSQCDGDLQPGKLGTAYRTAYTKAFGKLDTASNNPSNYDLLYFVNAAVKKAGGKVDAKSLDKALKTTSYTGVCGTFKANADNDLMTTMYIVSADGGATNKKVVATYKTL
jgi:hypothetical protein